ncbi:hypothetical protein DL93DRAFT_2085642 [Clavulina sp. PMI_390]|nr:hypothetical protein DL93DRAFT_2085642 [Clavulina sp. PMI_390]
MVQAFFVSRYWTVSRNIITTIVLVALVTTALALGLYVTTKAYGNEGSFQILQSINSELIAWLTFAASTDVLIAATLAFEMRKRRTGIFKTDSVLTHVGVYGVATGAVTAAAVTAQLLLFTIWNIFEAIVFFGLSLGGLYIATFLANLHTRSSLRTLASQPQSNFIELSGLSDPHRTKVTVTSTVQRSRDA